MVDLKANESVVPEIDAHCQERCEDDDEKSAKRGRNPDIKRENWAFGELHLPPGKEAEMENRNNQKDVYVWLLPPSSWCLARRSDLKFGLSRRVLASRQS